MSKHLVVCCFCLFVCCCCLFLQIKQSRAKITVNKNVLRASLNYVFKKNIAWTRGLVQCIENSLKVPGMKDRIQFIPLTADCSGQVDHQYTIMLC